MGVPEALKPARTAADVHVLVRERAMGMRRGFNASAAAQCPEPKHDQSNANDALAPGGNDLDWRQQIAQQDREKSDEHYAGGVTNSPAAAHQPAALFFFNGQRSDGGQMIGPGEHMEESGEPPRCEHQHQGQLSTFNRQVTSDK